MRAVGDVTGFGDVDDATPGRWFHGYGAYLVDFGRSASVAAHGQLIKAEVAGYLEGRLAELEAPFGMTEKLTTTEVTVGGVHFPAGTEVALVLASANRDEARHPDPDTFDLDRADTGHASFGYGMHFCVGHYVARQLAQVMIEEIFARLPGLRRDPDREPLVHGWFVRAATASGMGRVRLR